MKLKLDANGNVVVQDGKPVYVLDDGREIAHDAAATVAKISSLNGEAMSHRQAKEAAEAALKPFKDAGIEDPAAAAAALQTVANIASGDLTTAAKVQEIRDAATRSANEAVATATRAAEEKQRALTEQNTKLTQDLNNHIVGGSFTGSKFIADKMAIPADIAQKVFGDRFKVDNGKLVPLDAAGNPIFSATNHGNHADFDEAIQVMVAQYPNKDMILKGSGASGGGASGGGAGAAGGKSISRAQFDAMDGASRAAAMKGGATISD
ncbi:DUF6651 domain-containing protein [Duganella violaceipulchra]|uniref:DUF6651 domain-containing protein n=1 Tax=Duganella violaceipulchra TaxID=2849652 RepID=A0AA41L3M0_9BURK|nr:DUF6651 domain-containing protein [Duganella violaceicalia]MBV6321909.1 hypothetical protein [Duganella violaceicalia]MCP2007097.1 hypothetical protein [Duganella violaceicalia]